METTSVRDPANENPGNAAEVVKPGNKSKSGSTRWKTKLRRRYINSSGRKNQDTQVNEV
jgi:hypothetical protein